MPVTFSPSALSEARRRLYGADAGQSTSRAAQLAKIERDAYEQQVRANKAAADAERKAIEDAAKQADDERKLANAQRTNELLAQGRRYHLDRVTGEPRPLQTDEEFAAAKADKARKAQEAQARKEQDAKEKAELDKVAADESVMRENEKSIQRNQQREELEREEKRRKLKGIQDEYEKRLKAADDLELDLTPEQRQATVGTIENVKKRLADLDTAKFEKQKESLKFDTAQDERGTLLRKREAAIKRGEAPTPSPEPLIADPVEFEQSAAQHQAEVDQLNAEQAQQQAKMAALEAENERLMSLPHSAADVSEDGKWHKDVIPAVQALNDVAQNRGPEWQAKQQRIQEQARVLDESAKAMNAQAQAANEQAKAEQIAAREAAYQDFEKVAPGMGKEYQAILDDSDKRAAALRTKYAGREDAPEAKAAFTALEADITGKLDGLQGRVDEVSTKKQTGLNSLYDKFAVANADRDHLYDWTAKTSTDTDAAKAKQQADDAAYAAKKGLPGYSYRAEIDKQLDEEAKRLGIDPKEARTYMETRRRLDWSKPLTGEAVEGGKELTRGLREAIGISKMLEPTRKLPDGSILANPILGGDEEAFKASIEAADGTLEQKAEALKQWPALRRNYGDSLLAVFAKQTAIGEDFNEWRETGKAKSTDPAEQALEYQEEMKGRSFLRRWGDVIASQVTSGFMDVTQAALGSTAAIAGKVPVFGEFVSELAAANAENASSLVNTLDQTSNTGATGKVVGSLARMTPGVLATIGTGSLAGGMIFGGAQTAGSLYGDAYGKLREDGLSHDEAWKASAPASIAAGAMTAGLTKLFPGGSTAILRSAEARQSVRTLMAGFMSGGMATVKSAAKGALDELPEEIIDEGVSQFAQAAAEGRDPQQAVRDFITGLPELMATAGIMGGGMQAFSDYRDRRAGGTPPAPAPEVPEAPTPDAGPLPEEKAAVQATIAAFNPTAPEAIQAMPAVIRTVPKGQESGINAKARAAMDAVAGIASGEITDPASLTETQMRALGVKLDKGGKLVSAGGANSPAPLIYTRPDKAGVDQIVITDEARDWIQGAVPDLAIGQSEAERIQAINTPKPKARTPRKPKAEKPVAETGPRNEAPAPEAAASEIDPGPITALTPTQEAVAEGSQMGKGALAPAGVPESTTDRPALGKAPPLQRKAIGKGMKGGSSYAEFATVDDADAFAYAAKLRAMGAKNVSPAKVKELGEAAKGIITRISARLGISEQEARPVFSAYNVAVRTQAKAVREGESFYAPTLAEFMAGNENQPKAAQNNEKPAAVTISPQAEVEETAPAEVGTTPAAMTDDELVQVHQQTLEAFSAKMVAGDMRVNERSSGMLKIQRLQDELYKRGINVANAVVINPAPEISTDYKTTERPTPEYTIRQETGDALIQEAEKQFNAYIKGQKGPRKARAEKVRTVILKAIRRYNGHLPIRLMDGDLDMAFASGAILINPTEAINRAVSDATGDTDAEKESHAVLTARDLFYHEFIHRYVSTMIGDARVMDVWERLPEASKAAAERAYSLRVEARTGEAFRLSPRTGGHEYYRMMVELTLEGRMTEATIGKGLAEKWQKILNDILAFLRDLERQFAGIPNESARKQLISDVQGDIKLVTDAIKAAKSISPDAEPAQATNAGAGSTSGKPVEGSSTTVANPVSINSEKESSAKKEPQKPEGPAVKIGDTIMDSTGMMGPVIGFEGGVPVMGMEGENEGDIDPQVAVGGWTLEAEAPEVAKPTAEAPTVKDSLTVAPQDEGDAALGEAFAGLFASPTVKPLAQSDLPKDRRDAMMKAASTLIDLGLRKPEELAQRLDKLAPNGALRKYTRAFWRLMSGFDSTLEENPHWPTIYGELDEAMESMADTKPDAIRDLILSDDSRAKKAQAMKKLSEERGETLKETQEFVESRLVQIADEVARNGNEPTEQFNELVDIYNKQPSFSARTSTSMENQAYSTPAPMAFVLRHMTGVTPETSVYDATAGNGMLTIGADLKNSTANEIDETRLAGLRRLGIGTITTEDATDPTGAFQNRPKAQVVHLNPPFGSFPNTSFNGYGIRKLEHIISLQALKEGMADNGTAAIILGATMNNQEQVKGAQWVFENYLYGNYNVVDNFEVSGELYGNQGAKWPVRILVIAGKKANPVQNQDLAPRTVDRLDTWPDVWARAERTRYEVERQRQTLGTDGQTSAPASSPTGSEGTADAGTVPSGERPTSSTPPRGGRGGRNQGGKSPTSDAGPGSSGLASTGLDEQQADGGTSDQPATGGRKPTTRVEDDRGRSPKGTQDAPSGSSPDSGRNDAPKSNQSNAGGVKRDRKKAEATATQVPYDPASNGKPFETLVPRGIGEALQTALAEIVENRGPIDQFVADSLNMSVEDLQKAMAAEQIDGVAMAIYQMETGGALIIGDETGIGKGRQAASLIRYAILKGKVPVFFTKDPKLFSDMWGDLKDIGTTVTGPNASASDLSVRPLVLGDAEKAQIKTPENTVVLKPASNAKQNSLFAKAREDGFAATGHNAIFATYSQIRDLNARQEFLEWLAANEDVVVVLDEAHESAGDGETSMQAAFMMGGTIKRGKGSNKTEITKSGLLNGPGAMHPRGGVLYLSATFAKRPDNMPVYYRTDLRRGADNFEQVVEAMTKGGVALQQSITEALAEAGQYTRRERDFTGVSYAMKPVVVQDEAGLVRQVDEVTNVLALISDFSKRIKAAVQESTAQGDNATSMTDFASIVHNQVSQLLLAAKADAVVDEVLEAHKRGEKPIVALMNTMESFLSQYVDDLGIKPGQPITLNWSSLLEYALSRTLRASEKLPNGDTEIYIVDPAEHGLGRYYNEVLKAARNVSVTFPISPIDYIIQKSRAGGVEVGELTGRESGIDYTNFSTGAGTYRRFKKADKNTLVNTFNDGSLAGLLLNASGSTGLSIHASEKFKDQKPRHMIIAQPALDINVFIQTLGRIKRTGIVLLGRYPDGSLYGARYSHLTLPLNSEMRPAIMAARKMKSLNANTTGESDSAVKIEAEDLMNRFGNLVVAEYLNRNTDLADALNLTVDENEDGTVVVPPDIARKFTGRMALQTNARQGEAYAEIIEDYRRAVEQAKVTGDYDLEIIVHEDWDATKAASERIVTGTDESSIFTSSVNVELWDMTDNRPTPSGADMLAEFTKENGSNEQLDARWQKFSSDVDQRLEALEGRLQARLVEANARLAEMNQEDPSYKGAQFEAASVARQLAAIGVKKTRWRDTQRRLDDLIDDAGKPVTLEDAETRELDQGMMTQVKFPDITGQLRIAPSAFKFTYLLNRPGGRIYPTLAQFKPEGYAQSRSMYSVEDMTGDRGGRRERRTILVGSPIRAFGATGGKGKVVRFKSREGDLVTGIMMPRSWGINNLAEDPRKELADADAVGRYLTGLGWNPGFVESGESVRIHRGNGTFYITAPSARRTGGDIFLDRDLRAISEFRKSGNRMRSDAIYDIGDVVRAAARIVQLTGKRFKGQDVALVRRANGVDESDTGMNTSARPKSEAKKAATEAWNRRIEAPEPLQATPTAPKVSIPDLHAAFVTAKRQQGDTPRVSAVYAAAKSKNPDLTRQEFMQAVQSGQYAPLVTIQDGKMTLAPITEAEIMDAADNATETPEAILEAWAATADVVEESPKWKTVDGRTWLTEPEAKATGLVYYNIEPDEDGLNDPVTEEEWRNLQRGKVYDIEAEPLQASPTVSRDAEYMAAVEAGDMEKAQRMVDEAAKAAGYTAEAHHGTPYGEITVFDETKSPEWYEDIGEDDEGGNYSPGTTWFSSSKFIADGYAGGLYAQKAGPYKADGIPVKDQDLPEGTTIRLFPGNGAKSILLTDEQVAADKLPESALTPTGRMKNRAQLQVHFPNGSSLGGAIFVNRNGGKEPSSPQHVLRLAREIYNLPIAQRETSRTYRVFLKLLNPAVVDMKGEKFARMGRKADGAKYNGHDGIVVQNVRDPGSNPTRAPIATTYGVFSPNQIKSADPVTRDAGGNVIPLSQRFNPESDSILYASPTVPKEPFYSKLAQVIEQKMPNRADVATIKGLITNPQTGIKAEELKWSGILPWIEAQASPITKQAVLDYLATDGAVRLEEVRMGDKITRILPDENGRYSAYAGNALVQSGLTMQQAEEMELRQPGGKFSQYQLPGGENYREVVLAMTETAGVKELSKAEALRQLQAGQPVTAKAVGEVYRGDEYDVNGPDDLKHFPTEGEERYRFYGTSSEKLNLYTSSHFPDVPNYVAHARLNDRTDAEGKPGTFIEEIQSDRHQAGRDKGYQLTDSEREREWQRIVAIPAEQRTQADVTLLDRLKDELRSGASRVRTGIPDAPFRSTWPLQMFKRALADAVAAGKQWIGWTTGATQSERYDMSKQVGDITAKLLPNGYILGADGGEIASGVPAEKLADYVGKEIAQKIINEEGEPLNNGNHWWYKATKPEGIRELGANVFGAKMAGLMPLDIVDGGVLTASNHNQVRQFIVSLLPVDVVDNLRAAKLSPNDLFSNQDVVFENLPVNRRDAVARGVVDAVRTAGTAIRAKLESGRTTRRDELLLPTLKASDLNSREVASLLSPESIFHSGAYTGEKATTSALPRAESSGLAGGQKLRPAELAAFLDLHASNYARNGEIVKQFEAPSGVKLSGDDLKIESAGMNGFYDTILPKEIGKYVKPWGAVVVKGGIQNPRANFAQGGNVMGVGGEWFVVDDRGNKIEGPFNNADKADSKQAELMAGETPIWRVDITPQMRTSVDAGQALFATPSGKEGDTGKKPRRTIDPATQGDTPTTESNRANPGDSPLNRRAAANARAKYEAEEMTQVKFDDLRSAVAKELERDFDGNLEDIEYKLADIELNGGGLSIEDQEKVRQLANKLSYRGRLEGDRMMREQADRLLISNASIGSELGRGLALRRDQFKTPQERLDDAMGNILAPSQTIIRERTINVKTKKERDAIITEIIKENDAKIDAILKRNGLTQTDLFLSVDDRFAMQEAILGLARVHLSQQSAAHKKAIEMSVRGYSDNAIAKETGLTVAEVSNTAEHFRNVVAKQLTAREVGKGNTFSKFIQWGKRIISEMDDALRATPSGKRRNLAEDLANTRAKKRNASAQEVAEAVRSILDTAIPTKSQRNSNWLHEATWTYGKKTQKVFVPYNAADWKQVYRVARELSTREATKLDKAYEYWINGILSGPQTHVVNTASNLLSTAWAYGPQWLAEATTNVAIRNPNAPQFGEFKHIWAGFYKGIMPALRNFALAWDTEADPVEHQYLNKPVTVMFQGGNLDKVGGIRPSLGGTLGRYVRMPGRLLVAQDAFAKTLIMHAESAAMAYRLGKKQGLTKTALENFIATQIATHGSESWQHAFEKAAELTFQDENDITKSVETVTNAFKRAKFVGFLFNYLLPFVRTPTNIYRAGIRKAGGSAGMLLYRLGKSGYYAIKGDTNEFRSYREGAMVKDVSESVMALAFWFIVMGMSEGDDDDNQKAIEITGSRPFGVANAGERASQVRQEGGSNLIIIRKNPFTGEKLDKPIQFAYGRYEPIALALSTLVDGAREFKKWTRFQPENRTTDMLAGSIMRHVLAQAKEKTFLQGISGIMQFYEDAGSKNFSAKELLMKNLMNGAIPNLIRQPYRLSQDEIADAKKAESELSRSLGIGQPKVNEAGQPVQRGGNAVTRVLFPVASKPSTELFDAALKKWNTTNPDQQWNPDPLTKADLYVYGPKVDGKMQQVPLKDPAKITKFEQEIGQKFADYSARKLMAAGWKPGKPVTPQMIDAIKEVRTNAIKSVRASMGREERFGTTTPATAPSTPPARPSPAPSMPVPSTAPPPVPMKDDAAERAKARLIEARKNLRYGGAK